MSVENFYCLHNILEKHLTDMFDPSNRIKTSTYFISTTIRLSIDLRYFAGGDPLDIMMVHNVSRSSVYNSVWGL